MHITERKLRSIIRSVIEESWRDHSKIDSIRHGEPTVPQMRGGHGMQRPSTSRQEIEDAIQSAIDRYIGEQGMTVWKSFAKADFENMAEGGSGGIAEDNVTSIREYYYSGWEDNDFQTVIDEVEEIIYY